MTDKEARDYVLIDQFGGTGADGYPFGPYTFAEADALLRQGAAITGDYYSNQGYHSDYPMWAVRDDYSWVMRKLDRDFSGAFQTAKRDEDDY